MRINTETIACFDVPELSSFSVEIRGHLLFIESSLAPP
jgi:hypothetical protein